MSLARYFSSCLYKVKLDSMNIDSSTHNNIDTDIHKPHPEVIRGENGHLFISGGRQRVEDYIFGRIKIKQESFRNFENNLRDRRILSKKVGAKFVHVLCPDKQSVYREEYPYSGFMNLGEVYAKNCSEKFLYPLDELRDIKSKQNVYYITDSHWNDTGAKVVAGHILEIGLGFNGAVEHLNHMRSKTFVHATSGDCGKKLTPPESEIGTWYPDVYKKIYADNNFKHNLGILRTIVNPYAPGDTRLLIFGDSFINHCISMLTDFFRFTLYIRTPFMHPEAVYAFRPTHIISSNVERYLSDVRSDAEAGNFLLMAFMRGLNFDQANPIYKVLDGLLSSSPSSLDEVVTQYVGNLQKNGENREASSFIDAWCRFGRWTEKLAIIKSRAELKNGNKEGSLKYAELAVKTTGRSASALIHKGAVLMQMKRFLEAKAVVNEALTIAPSNFVGYRTLAMILRKAGDNSGALFAAEKAVECSNYAPSVVSYRDRLYREISSMST